MPILPLRVEELTLDHLNGLVAASAREDQHLDFKSTLPDLDGKNGERAKKDLLGDVAAFANAGGGDIVFGVEEGRDSDGKANGVAVGLPGVTIENFDALERRWVQILEAGLDPRLSPKVRLRALDNGATKLLVLRVPRSIASPHMLKDHGRFYARRGAQNLTLNTGELRAAFELSEAWADRVRRFRDDRLAKIVADETPVLLDAPDRFVFHLVALGSQFERTVLDLGKLKSVRPPSVVRSSGSRFNVEGVAIIPDEHEGRSHSYVQFFRDGAVEIVSFAGAGTREGEFFISRFERDTMEWLATFLPILEGAGAARPFALLVSLVGLKGMRPVNPDPYARRSERPAADRDLYTLPDVLIADELTAFDGLLRPVFDTLWQSFGFEKSPNFDAAGK